ncbi:MAG: hypothetical protein WBK28_03150 [Minisyncoccia bacterium]
MMEYLVEFMKFLCGFGVILAVALALFYFAGSEVAVADLSCFA